MYPLIFERKILPDSVYDGKKEQLRTCYYLQKRTVIRYLFTAKKSFPTLLPFIILRKAICKGCNFFEMCMTVFKCFDDRLPEQFSIKIFAF